MRNGFFPTPRAFLLFVPPFILMIAAFAWEPLLFVAIGLDCLGLLVLVADFLLSPNYKKKLEITPQFPLVFTINTRNRFVIRVTNENRLPVRLRILFDFDLAFDRDYADQTLKIKGGASHEFALDILARRRGAFTVNRFFIKGRSLFGFLAFFRRREADITVKVPPFIDPVNQVFKMTQKKIKQNEGMQKSAYLGEGRDFEMLKDYMKGDDFNRIDWKATARVRKPVTRVYRLENSMEVAMLVDCGRIMATEVGGMSLLDYAANAALILAWSAVRNYDTASLLCFGSGIKKYIPPVKTKKDIHKFELVLSEIEFEHVEPDYREALRVAAAKLTKRSIILLFTDIIDDSNTGIFHQYLSVMRKRHIVIVILIRDKNLFHTAYSPVMEAGGIYAKAAAADLVLRRNKTIHSLRRLGVDVLDLYPEDVSARLLSRYLEVKARN